MEHAGLTLAAVGLLALGSQWLAWRLKVPAILTSRSDSFQTKVNSIALAAVVAAGLAE